MLLVPCARQVFLQATISLAEKPDEHTALMTQEGATHTMCMHNMTHIYRLKVTPGHWNKCTVDVLRPNLLSVLH